MQPKVSLIMSCYNSLPYLDGMLESVLAQRYDNIELIAVDGGSKDETFERLLWWIARFEIRGYEMKCFQKPGDITTALTEGLRHFTGEYICFPDSDDFLEKDYVKDQAEYLSAHPEYGWVRCQAVAVPADHPEKVNYLIKDEEIEDIPPLYRFLLPWTLRVAWMMMVRADYLRACIPGLILDNTHSTHEWAIMLPIAHGGECGYVKKQLYRFYQHANSRIRRELKQFEHSLRYLDTITNAARQTLDRILLSSEQKNICSELLYVWDLHHRLSLCKEHDQTDLYEVFKEQASQVYHRNFPEKQIPAHTVFMQDIYLVEAVCRKSLGLPAIREDKRKIAIQTLSKIASAKHLYVYAGGYYCKAYLPLLIQNGIKPELIWDRNAENIKDIEDIAVCVPDFSSIPVAERNDDVIFVFLSNHNISQEVTLQLTQAGFSNVITQEVIETMLRYWTI